MEKLVIFTLISLAAAAGLDVPKYLEHYGYASPSMFFHNDMSGAIADFQSTYSLKVTGKMDDATTAFMETARCGNPDKDDKVSYAYTQKWPKKELTYFFDSMTKDLYEKDLKELTRKAFQFWSDVSGLSFRETKGSGDIIIGFGGKSHSDSRRGKCSSNFDGRGNVLAHAFYPTDGRLHFDDDEKFAKSRWSIGGKNYLWIATHEIGHILGLSHDTANKDAVMYPYYRSFNSNMKLSPSDISRIRNLYGN